MLSHFESRAPRCWLAAALVCAMLAGCGVKGPLVPAPKPQPPPATTAPAETPAPASTDPSATPAPERKP